MDAPTNNAATERPTWLYASLTVFDGPRKLKPMRMGPEYFDFREPPRLISKTVEIIVKNGDREYRSQVRILPHDPEATRIPVRTLLSANG